MAANASSKQLYIDNTHIKDLKELKVTWGTLIHGYTEKFREHHTTKCIMATAGTISFCFSHMTVTKVLTENSMRKSDKMTDRNNVSENCN